VLDSSSEHVPVRITSKMAARAEYERKLKELGSEEEDDLEVFNEAEASPDEDAMEQDEAPSPQDKGKSRMMESEDPERGDQRDSGRKRPRIDPFAGNLDLDLFRGPSKLTHSQDTVTIIVKPPHSPRNPISRKRSHLLPPYLWQIATRLPRHQINQAEVLLYQPLRRSSREKRQRKPDGRRRSR
jgi:hypothetical protein